MGEYQGVSARGRQALLRGGAVTAERWAAVRAEGLRGGGGGGIYLQKIKLTYANG